MLFENITIFVIFLIFETKYFSCDPFRYLLRKTSKHIERMSFCLVENLDVNNVGDAVCEGFFCVDRVINADDGDVLNNEVIPPLTARDKKMIAAAMMMEVDEI